MSSKLLSTRIYLPRLANAFTLIELLVVIAIIVLLVSILVPSLNVAKELARSAVCLGNIRNITLAATMYAYENHGKWMYGGTTSSIDGDGAKRYYGWFGSYRLWEDDSYVEEDAFLYPYMGDADLSDCPSFESTARLFYGPVDYAYNVFYLGGAYNSGAANPKADGLEEADLSDLTTPSETAAFWDNARLRNGELERSFIGFPTSESEGLRGPNFHGRHRGDGNIGWADGHAGSFEPAQYASDVTEVHLKNDLGDIDHDDDDSTDELYDRE